MRKTIPARILCALMVIALVPVALATRGGIADAATCATTTQTPLTTVYLPNITKTLGGPAGWVTPFYIQNAGAVQTTVDITFFRFSDGVQVTCRRTTGLAPGTTLADNPNTDSDLPDNTQFSVVVKSYDAAVVATVNQMQGSGATQQALSYSGFTQGATTVYLPNVTRRFFGYDVPFIIQDLGALTAIVTARFVSFDGTQTFTKSVQIVPSKSAVVDPDFEPASTGVPNAGLVDGTQYAVTLTSTQPIAVVVNAHNEQGSPVAFSHNGLTGGGTTLYAPYAVKTAAIGGVFSPVVVQNLGTTPTDATLTFMGLTGVPQVFTLRAIPAGGSKAFDPRFTAGTTTPCSTQSATCLGLGEFNLKITAANAIAAVVLPNSSTTAAGYLASSQLSARALVPIAMRRLGGIAGWTTKTYIYTGQAANLTIRLFSIPDGELRAAATYTVPPTGSGVFELTNIPGLVDNGQYSMTIDGGATPLTAIALEQAATGGDASMIFEAFGAAALTLNGQPGSLRLSPTIATLAVGASQQFTATVRDPLGAAMTGAVVNATVAPTSLGTVMVAGSTVTFIAATSGTGTLTVTTGTLAATAAIAVTVPSSTTVGGIGFSVSTSGPADVYTQTTINATDVSRVVTQVNSDVIAVQTDFGRPFTRRPTIYVFATTTSYITGLQTIFHATPEEAQQFGVNSAGLFDTELLAIAADWQKIGTIKPLATLRHEITHMMEHQIVPLVVMPTWFDEGNARLEDLTVTGGQYRTAQSRYSAASMAATNTLFSLADLTSLTTWNSRTGAPMSFQYHAAAQATQLIKNDIGMAGVVRILDLMGQGQPFENAYTTASGQPFSTFSAAYPTRIRALAQAYPAIVTAPDTPEGSGLFFQLYGFPPNSSVTIIVSGTASSQPATVTVTQFGTYASYLGSSWPAGSYGIQANWSGGIVTTQATKTSSVFDPWISLDPGVPLVLELPPDASSEWPR